MTDGETNEGSGGSVLSTTEVPGLPAMWGGPTGCTEDTGPAAELQA